MSAPLSKAMVFRTVVPFSAVSGVVCSTLLINDFLEMPETIVAVFIQIVEQLIVGFKALSKTDAWIKDDLLLAVCCQNFTLLPEKVQYGLADVATESILVHGLWRSHTVHHHVGDMVFADEWQHFFIEKSA